MANILNFTRRPAVPTAGEAATLADFLRGFSIEVMPRTAARIEDFRAILPAGTRVYVAHIDGTATSDMVATCRRLVDEGFDAMPHVPARGLASHAELEARLKAHADVGVREALAIAGGIDVPRGPYPDTMSMPETGLFDSSGFTRIHVAGHPEGNRDIDPAGGEAGVTAALRRKNAFQARTDARMAIVTQFAFEPEPIVAWARRLREEGITLPVHIGIAGPAKLQTMIRFAMSCGVGPSLRVLQRRAADLASLILPFEPTGLLAALARRKADDPGFLVEGAHLFPLGGVQAAAAYAASASAAATSRARA